MRIHYHSDCPFFAGCEKMLVHFFQNEKLRENFQISFSYRNSVDYEKGLKKHFQGEINLIPLPLCDISDALSRIQTPILQKLAKISSYLFGIRAWTFLWNLIILYRTFGQQPIDLLHINNGGYPGASSCQAAVLAAKLRGVRKIVYMVNNIAYPYRSWSRRLGYLVDFLVSKAVSFFITSSQQAEQALTEVLKLPPSRTKIIFNGVKIRDLTESKKETFERLEIPSNKMVFTIISLLEKRKGHIYFLKALKHLRDYRKIDPLPLFVIEGNGPELEHLTTFVKVNSLESSVKFIGSEENIFNLINAVDVLLETSIAHSPTPNIIFEGMALGKVIIGSQWSSSEQIQHQENGILCDPQNVEELSNAIYQIIQDNSLRDKLAKNALKTFEKKFTAERAVENYCQVYTQLLRI